MFALNGKMPYEYKCFHVHTEIAPPEPRVEMLEVPLRDGALNVSSMLSTTVHYSTREIALGLETTEVRAEWPLIQEALMRDLHGQAVQLTLDDDPEWYWEGYAVVEQMVDNRGSAGWTIRITAQPFKRSEKEYVITGLNAPSSNRTINIDGLRGYPTFKAAASGVSVVYNGTTYPIPSDGSYHDIYGLFFIHGTNTFSFTYSGEGTTKVDIKWREGTL